MILGSCLALWWSCIILKTSGVPTQDLYHDGSVVVERAVTPTEKSCIVPSSCVFPFTYNGVEYTECTTDGGAGEYWCSHTYTYQWLYSYCTCPGMYEVSVSPDCVYPESCVFPFEYDCTPYDQCTTVNNDGRYWCAHDSEYSVWGDWSSCVCTTTIPETLPENPCDAPADCVFPFEYKGITYLTCTTVDNWGDYWCSHDAEHASFLGGWSDCDCPDECICPEEYKDNCECPNKYEVTVPLEENPCEGDCTFPFVYASENYSTCTTDDFGQYVCSPTDIYDGVWSDCDCQDKATKILPPDYPCIVPDQCVFPFTYKDVTYVSCAQSGRNSYWCSHNTAYKGSYSDCICPLDIDDNGLE